MAKCSTNDKIYIAGHTGLAGSAIQRIFEKHGYTNICTKKHSELDLNDSEAVNSFFKKERPDVVILAAGKVGGIQSNNNNRANFIYENLQIQNNVIWASHTNNVHRLIFLGSSSIYPKFSEQPLKENYILNGILEYTNQPYSIAKIAGIELVNCIRKQFQKDFFSIIPANLFGINDNFSHDSSHIIASLIRKFDEASKKNLSSVIIWGDGTPLREFLYSDELASAVLFLAESISYSDFESSILGSMNISHINIGSGDEFSIKDIAYYISEAFNYKCDLQFDKSKPNGIERKLLDSSILYSFGWKKQLNFINSLKKTIDWYVLNKP